MLVPLLALLFAATSTPDQCIVAHPAAYRDTNQLVLDGSFGAAVRCFLGDRRAAYLDGNAAVAHQVIEVLGGPPDQPARIGELLRFTACRARSCSEKGAAVIGPDGAIVALAILHSACGAATVSEDCFAHHALTIFISAVDGRPVIDDLSAWARDAIAKEYNPARFPAATLDGVEVIPVS